MWPKNVPKSTEQKIIVAAPAGISFPPLKHLSFPRRLFGGGQEIFGPTNTTEQILRLYDKISRQNNNCLEIVPNKSANLCHFSVKFGRIILTMFVH